MRWSHQFRGWKRAAFYGLLALTMHRLVAAETSQEPAQIAATPATKKTSTPSSANSSAHSSSIHNSSAHPSKSARRKKSSRKRGQQAIDSSRTREIQAALIREHYMQGEPSGTWDSASQSAMKRYQADHGWQSKTTPDSRALIQLGLGPNSDHLLNPDSAMTTVPPNAKATSPAQGAQQNNLNQH
jgi:hypothetical protein